MVAKQQVQDDVPVSIQAMLKSPLIYIRQIGRKLQKVEPEYRQMTLDALKTSLS